MGTRHPGLPSPLPSEPSRHRDARGSAESQAGQDQAVGHWSDSNDENIDEGNDGKGVVFFTRARSERRLAIRKTTFSTAMQLSRCLASSSHQHHARTVQDSRQHTQPSNDKPCNPARTQPKISLSVMGTMHNFKNDDDGINTRTLQEEHGIQHDVRKHHSRRNDTFSSAADATRQQGITDVSGSAGDSNLDRGLGLRDETHKRERERITVSDKAGKGEMPQRQEKTCLARTTRLCTRKGTDSLDPERRQRGTQPHAKERKIRDEKHRMDARLR